MDNGQEAQGCDGSDRIYVSFKTVTHISYMCGWNITKKRLTCIEWRVATDITLEPRTYVQQQTPRLPFLALRLPLPPLLPTTAPPLTRKRRGFLDSTTSFRTTGFDAHQAPWAWCVRAWHFRYRLVFLLTNLGEGRQQNLCARWPVPFDGQAVKQDMIHKIQTVHRNILTGL